MTVRNPPTTDQVSLVFVVISRRYAKFRGWWLFSQSISCNIRSNL